MSVVLDTWPTEALRFAETPIRCGSIIKIIFQDAVMHETELIRPACDPPWLASLGIIFLAMYRDVKMRR